MYSVVAGKADPTDPVDIMNISAGMRLIYGYVLNEDAKSGIWFLSISVLNISSAL